MLRLIALSVILTLILTGLASMIVFCQRRTFPDDEGAIVFYEWSQQNGEQVYSVRPTGGIFGADLVHLLSGYDLDQMNPDLDGIDCAPDGRSLILQHTGLMRFNLANKTITYIPDTLAYVRGVAESPNGQWIAYNDTEIGAIVVVDFDGALIRLLFTPNGIFATSLAWSPDNRQIVFTAETEINGQDHFSLHVIDITTGRAQTIYDNADRLDAVSWSPDGTHIAFQMQNFSSSDIYTIQPDGSNLRRLTYANPFNSYPHWSPDGALISYSELDLSGHFQVYVMNADDSDPYLVYAPPRGEDAFDLCWLKN